MVRTASVSAVARARRASASLPRVTSHLTFWAAPASACRIADGVLVNDGTHAMSVIRQLLARPDVALVHLRNVGYGCYNFAVRRG